MTTDPLIPGTTDDGGSSTRTRPPEGLLRAGEVAKSHRVTPQAVGVWVREHGMPVAHTDELGRRYFDAEAVRLWVSANRPRTLSRQGGGGHGGQRAGNGRRRKWRQGVREDAPLLDRAGGEDDRGGGRGDSGASGGGASPLTQEKTRVESLKAQRMEMELAEKRRELLKRSEVEAAIVAAARNLGGLCTTMSQRLAAEIVSRAALPAGMFPVVEDLIRIECDGLVDALLADPMGDAAGLKAAA